MREASIRRYILVVDDEESVRDVVSEALEAAGYDVTTAASGFEAIELLTGAPFDLMFLDIKMPGMSGQQVLDWVKTERRDMPVVMLTAVTGAASEAEFRQRGALGYLTKPCSMMEIVSPADRILKGDV